MVYVGNGSGLPISSSGSSHISTSIKPLLLKDVLHVPGITKNLLSIHKLTNDNNIYFEFHANFCLMKDKKTNQILLQGTIKDGLYHFTPHLSAPSAHLGEKAPMNTWHNQLGHLNFKALLQIIKKHGLLASHLPKHFLYDACCLSKSHKLPFELSPRHATKPLELIHSDLWGPAPVISHFGFQYYVVFIDDYRRYTWMYPLKRKNDVFQVFVEFRKRIEN